MTSSSASGAGATSAPSAGDANAELLSGAVQRHGGHLFAAGPHKRVHSLSEWLTLSDHTVRRKDDDDPKTQGMWQRYKAAISEEAKTIEEVLWGEGETLERSTGAVQLR